MKEGPSNTIEYSWTDGVRRTASLGMTDVHQPNTPVSRTDDPKWHVEEVNGAVGDFEWLNYIMTDGTTWRVKVHCEFQEPTQAIKVWMEHEATDGTHNHDDTLMGFRDWDGMPWRADISQYLHRPFPVQPSFLLKREA